MGLGGWFASGSFEWLRSLAIAVGLALIIRWTLAEPFRIPSGSMEPTLHGDPGIGKGDRVFVNKLTFGIRWPLNKTRVPFLGYRIHYADKRIWRWHDPQRWDIVVFKAVEEDAVHTTLVKRVVGLPGERIHIEGGKVFVNDKPLELPPGMPPVYYTSPRGVGTDMKYGILTDDAHAVVPQDCYLLLGDNSEYSRDGRFFGWVPNENILGRAACIWWPIWRWRDFTGFSKTWWWHAIVAIVSALLFVRILVGRSWRAHVQTPAGAAKIDHFFINRWAFGVPVPFTRRHLTRGRAPRRGELVLYYTKSKDGDAPSWLFGRVAGLPGERVYIDRGKIQIDGEPLSEPRELAEREFAPGEGVGPFARSKGKEFSAVPPDHYFLVTDSPLQEEHYDSRTVGWVPYAGLIGAASAVWWPPSRWRRAR